MTENRPPAAENAALTETWRKYRGWAKRARTLRAELDRGRITVLVLTVAGAVLATLASQYPVWTGTAPGSVAARTLGGLGAVAMALAAYFSRSILDPALERQWLRARALAEACKSEAYRFATGAAPYGGGADDGRRLLDRLQRFLTAGADIPAMEVDEADARAGLPDYPLPAEAYVVERLDDQIERYYRPKAAENERRATRYAAAVQALGALAAVFAALGAMAGSGLFEPWVAVIGAIAAAVGSHALAQRFQRLAATYRVAADRLAVRLALWRIDPAGAGDPAAARALVADAEAILGAENEAWLADATDSRAGSSGGSPEEAAIEDAPASAPTGPAEAIVVPASVPANGSATSSGADNRR